MTMNAAMSQAEELYLKIYETAGDGLLITDLETGSVLAANPAAAKMHGYTGEELIGLLPAAFIHPDSQQAFSKYIRAFRSDAVFDTRVQHVRRDGSTFHAEWRGTAFTYQGKPCLLGAVRDVSRRIQTDQRLQQHIQARTREQSALLEISHALASSLEFQPGLILDQLRGIIEYTHAGLFALSDSTLTALAVRGPKDLEQAVPFEIRLEGPETLAALFHDHRPIRIADVHSADPAAESLRSLLSGDAAVLLEGVRAWMWVPLAAKGRIIGCLGVAHARRNHFTAHQAALALSMADQVAVTMVNAELYEHARALAALQERQRLARNLHDAVNQSLFSAGLIAEVLPRLWDRDPVEARGSLEDLRRLTRGAMAEMRELLAELRPSVLTDSSLGDLLRQLANAFTGRTNVPAGVTTAGEHVLSAEIQVALYRICQEALNNIAKHAGASRVEIDLQYESGEEQVSPSLAHPGVHEEIVVSSVEMRIRDDGHGFDPAQPATSGHYGMGMMRERALAVGARLTVSSSPGNGTEISVVWQPVPDQEAR
jgi:PAS domain S-box-containing protein